MKTTMTPNIEEDEFAKFVNSNVEKIKALAALSKMSESEKMELIKRFKEFESGTAPAISKP
jgi:hypothetical protein